MSDIKIRIDTRYYRMCIHRQALKAIGDPEYLKFAYDPEEMQLLVEGRRIDDRESVRVRYNNSGSVYVFSKPLIEGIRQVSHILLGNKTFLVEGKVRESENIIIFSLQEANILSEG
ncbi:MAG: hypothetical protein IJI45_07360 [Anaerolineaceae bacterium]|nr:hypothetical protein [Anaerolineaceae bacterium]